MRAALLLLSLPALVSSHGAVTHPRCRNSVDRDVHPYNRPPKGDRDVNDHHLCVTPGKDGQPSNSLAQACFWFSNGCIIGCDACNGDTRGPCYDGPDPKNPICGPNMQQKMDICPDGTKSKGKATICDPKMRTVNTGVECGSKDDLWYYSPWRSPGLSPVLDSCGVAGGHWWSQDQDTGDGAYGADYLNTTHAKLGDLGTKVLPYTPTNTTWKAGSTVEVRFALTANHAGGYQYRLCPRKTLDDNAGDPKATEKCFQANPLDFANNGTQAFRWNGDPSTDHKFRGVVVDGDLVVPRGSMWMKNPVPRTTTHEDQTGDGYPANCPNTDDAPCVGADNGFDPVSSTLEIIDHVVIPAGLAPGQWVLGWRWDCEESNQIWMSCSDVDITA